MITVLDILNRITGYFNQKQISGNSRYEAELMVASVLEMSRLELYLGFDRPLGGAELEKLRDLTRKRGEKIPLAYLLETLEFGDLNMAFEPGVLVPRPETETLIDEAVRLMEPLEEPKILEIGFGSGFITLSIALRINKGSFISVDIDPVCLKTATKNLKLNINKFDKPPKIDWVVADIIKTLPKGKYDLIVSNPPYVSEEEYKTLSDEITKNENPQALIGGMDGLKFYRFFAENLSEALNPGGHIVLEHGEHQKNSITRIFEEHDWKNPYSIKDINGKYRVFAAAC